MPERAALNPGGVTVFNSTVLTHPVRLCSQRDGQALLGQAGGTLSLSHC